MKSRKKWAIPFALAAVLLVGLLGVSQTVQAQSAMVFATVVSKANVGDEVLGADGSSMTISAPKGATGNPVLTATNSTVQKVFMVDDSGTLRYGQALATSSKALERLAPSDQEVTLTWKGVKNGEKKITINLLEELMFADDSASFSVRSNAATGTQVGVLMIDGASPKLGNTVMEVVDVLIDDGPFAAVARNVNGSYTQVILSVDGALSQEDSPYTFKVTINGADATRTDEISVTVTATASNVAPTVPADGFSATVKENDKGAKLLVKGGTAVGDASAKVTDGGDGDPLTYSDDSKMFDTDSDSGMVTVGKSGLAAGSGTTNADGDEEYTFNITVSDGIDGNDRKFPATVTVDVNEAVAIADAPASVKYAYNESSGYVIISLSDYASDADGDDIAYSMADVAPSDALVAPFSLIGTSEEAAAAGPEYKAGDLVLSWAGLRVEDDTTWTATISTNDGYENGTDDSVTIDVTLEAAPDLVAGSIECNLDENADAFTGGCSVASQITGASAYEIASGTGDGDTDFSIGSGSGAVMVVNTRDYETSANNNPVLLVEALDDKAALLGTIVVSISVHDVNEAPMFMAGAPSSLSINENAQPGATVGAPITASDVDDGDSVSYSVKESGVPFTVDANSGQVSVTGALSVMTYNVTLVASDTAGLEDEHAVSIAVGDVNDPPTFDQPATLSASLDEDVAAGTLVATYGAHDVDNGGDDMLNGIHYVLRDADDLRNFSIMSETTDGQIMGKLLVKDGANLDVDAAGTVSAYTVEVNVCDADNACNELTIDIAVNNVNDNAPMINAAAPTNIMVAENTERGYALGDFSASDADGDPISYSVDNKSFSISDSGMLMTLESLDADNGMMPCGATGCMVKVTASDGMHSDSQSVTVSVNNRDDSVSSFSISKANPVPGPAMGNANSALADAKTTMSSAVPERPADLPATEGSAPMNFVDTSWANWGTVLRIEVTAESPAAACGNGNQCVELEVESDSGDHKLTLEAYRSGMQENRYIAAVMLVDGSDDDMANPTMSDTPVYKDADGGVARLDTDEEDTIEIRLVGTKVAPISIDVENERPEIDNFAPEHESAFDDGDVDYTFTITDAVSGIPEPQDLPDTNGDDEYMPVIAVVSSSQCHLEDPTTYKDVPDDADSYTVVIPIGTDNMWCKRMPEIRPITDDRDFDEIDGGFDVDTKVVLDENKKFFVSFVVFDSAGNATMFVPDPNTTDEALPEITIDTEDPKIVEARTGIMWDSADEEIDKDNPTWIQVIFEDLTEIDEDSLETDDFVVEGHTIKDIKRYGDDADGSASGTSINNARSIFLELEDELAPDETPDVTVVPNGIADMAGNEQDDGDVEAKDYIAPSFTVVSIVSPRTGTSSPVLVGDDEEVVITITADERIQETRPDVTVTYVNAADGSVFTSVTRAMCDDGDGDSDTQGYRERGEIVNNGMCQDSDAAQGSELGVTMQKVSNTEWIALVDEPGDTGYYSIYISGHDRSSQRNEGSEGVAPDKIVVDFFERDGDVNSGDARYFQGDVNLPKPGVRVSGVQIEDTEPAVEFKTPLFVELDFTRPYISDCPSDASDDEMKADCMAESSEYAKDSFDGVTITKFTLDGVDMTDMVKTTDNETFLVSIDGISIGDHEIEIQAMDQAGNDLDDVLEIEFAVEERDPFSKRLNPGWNLVSIPGEPADSDISVVFGSDVEVRTIYTYDPIVPGGWMVAVRETLDSDWQGDLTDITARRGYWVLSDAIQDWEVSIPRLAGGAVGSGTPIQPPVIALYAGWNLVPVVDVTGNLLDDSDSISAQGYLQSLDDGLDLARVLGFDTITNQWMTIHAPESGASGSLSVGSAYWVFVRSAASLVPGN